MDSDKTNVFIGIIIFTLVFLFIVVVIIALAISDKQNITPNTNYETGLFLSPCLNDINICNNGLKCDGSSFTCKFEEGIPCTDFTDCITGLICSGICATGATGNLDNLCPCTDKYRCKAQLQGPSLCKGKGGTPCTINNDCFSNLCNPDNTCAAGQPDSFPCTDDEECSSKNCSKISLSAGFCQPIGIETGTLGSKCSFGENICINPPGTLGASCISSGENILTCQCSTVSSEPGVCITANQGVLSSCNINSACTGGLYCADTFSNNCTSGNTGCVCIFPYSNPNVLNHGVNCIQGMTLVSGKCLNNSGLGCDSNNMCTSNSCSGSSVMSVYNFLDMNTTAFIGVTGISINKSFSGPSFETNILPYKMFGFSSSNIDTIYLVDYIQGLVQIDYNVILRTPVSPGWRLIFPYKTITDLGTTTNTKTLIDAAYNQNIFLIAFFEEITNNSDGSLVSSNYTIYISNGTTITPFNPQTGPGIPGTQYDSSNKPLSINYIDVSQPNSYPSPGGDVLIATTSSTPGFNDFVYIKKSNETSYNIVKITGGTTNGTDMKSTFGPVRFYYDNIENPSGTPTTPPTCPGKGTLEQNKFQILCPTFNNIAFVGNYKSFGTPAVTSQQVLQFSGSIAGIGLPLDNTINSAIGYRVYDYDINSFNPDGMPGSSIIILASVGFPPTQFNIVALSFSGSTTIFPYNISTTSRSVATSNGFYILSINSCL